MQEDDGLVPLVPGAPKPPKRLKPPPPRNKKPAAKRPPVNAKAELLVRVVGGPPAGAVLVLDDRELGSIPPSAMPVSPGEHSIWVRKAGHLDFRKRVTAVPAKVTEVLVVLEPIAMPPTPQAEMPPRGDRPERVALQPPETDRPMAALGEDEVAEAAPRAKSAPLFQQWYFWAGAAAVVVAATAGTVVGIRAADEGAYQASLRASALCLGVGCPAR
jgi:hypothetical protein